MPVFFRKSTAIFLLFAFCATQFSYQPASMAAEASPAAKQTSIREFTPSPEFGHLEESWKGRSPKTLILIQDAHAAGDAQESIRQILDAMQKKGLGIGFLEGASGQLDPLLFRSFPEKKVLEKVFSGYTSRGEIAGAVAASVLNAGEINYYGVENEEAYQQGIRSFLEALKAKENFQDTLQPFKARLEELQKKFYSPEALEVSRGLRQFEENPAAAFGTVSKLQSYLKAEKARFPLLHALFSEMHGQSPDSLKSMDGEIRFLAGDLQKRVENPELAQKINLALQDYKTEALSLSAFAAMLSGIAKSKKWEMGMSLMLQEQVRLHEVMESIRGEGFFKEFHRYSSEIKNKVFKNPEELLLDRLENELLVFEKFAALELPRSEWELLKAAARPENSEVSAEAEKFQEDLRRAFRKLQEDFRAHADFYRNAESRENYLLKNILQIMDREKMQTAAVISGGFHTRGLVRMLKAQGISYRLITPVMRDIPEPGRYLALMRGDVSWKNYFKIKDGKIDLYDAFAKGASEQLMQAVEAEAGAASGQILRDWRSAIIKDLASRGEIARAGEYTALLDSMGRTEIKDAQPSWLETVDLFLNHLETLKVRKELTPEKIMTWNPSANGILAWPAIPLVRGTRVPASFFWNRLPLPRTMVKTPREAAGSARSEARTEISAAVPFSFAGSAASGEQSLLGILFANVEWVRGQRWFLEKESNVKIVKLELEDSFDFPVEGGAVLKGLLINFYLEGPENAKSVKRYFIPLLTSAELPADIPSTDVLPVEFTDGKRYVSFADHGAVYQRFILNAYQNDLVIKSAKGTLSFKDLGNFLKSIDPAGLVSEPLGVSTSNLLTAVTVNGKSLISKTYRDERGPSGEPGKVWPPNMEVPRYTALTGSGYPYIPVIHGAASYQSNSGAGYAVHLMMDRVIQESELGGVFWMGLTQMNDRMKVGKAENYPAIVKKNAEGLAEFTRQVAAIIAEMHHAFTLAKEASFRPEVMSRDELQQSAENTKRDFDHAVAAVKASAEKENAEALLLMAEKLQGILARSDAAGTAEAPIETIGRAIASMEGNLKKIQTHGDLSSAQGLIRLIPDAPKYMEAFLAALQSDDTEKAKEAAAKLREQIRWIDFEGPPAKDPVDDGADTRQPFFADLAGFTQGFWYILNIQLYIKFGLDPQNKPEDREKARKISLALAGEISISEAGQPGLTQELVDASLLWFEEMRDALVEGYLRTVEEKGIEKELLEHWDREQVKALLDYWILMRAIHELRYEVYARTWGWEAIPGGAILYLFQKHDLVERLKAGVSAQPRSELRRLEAAVNPNPQREFVSPVDGAVPVDGLFLPLHHIRSSEGWGNGDYETAKKGIDFSHKMGARIQQGLPNTWSAAYHSPYSVLSFHSLDPEWISIDALLRELRAQGIDLTEVDKYVTGISGKLEELRANEDIDHETITNLKLEALKKVWAAVQKKTDSSVFQQFSVFKEKNNDWLQDDMLYAELKNEFMQKDEVSGWNWTTWDRFEPGIAARKPEALRNARKRHAEGISFLSFVQFVAHKQSRELVEYGRKKNVSWVLDMAFPAPDAEVWKNPGKFGMDENAGFTREAVQGVPAKRENPIGQNWQTTIPKWPDAIPLYLEMFEFYLEQADYVRLDHVLGYYRVFAFLQDVKEVRTLEKLEIFKDIETIRDKALKAGTEEAKNEAVKKASVIIRAALLKEAAGLPRNIQQLLFDFSKIEDGLPAVRTGGNMIMTARKVPQSQWGEGPADSLWQRWDQMEDAVYSGQRKWDYIRLSPNERAGDSGFLKEYLFPKTMQAPQPADNLRIAFYQLGPGDGIMAEFLRLAQEKGKVVIAETLGTVTPQIEESTRRLSPLANFVPVIWGFSRKGRYHPTNKPSRGTISTLDIADSYVPKEAWEEVEPRDVKLALLREFYPDAPEAELEAKLAVLDDQVLEKMLEMVMAPQGIYPEIKDDEVSLMAVMTLMSLANLPKQYRLNFPGQTGQWKRKPPQDLSIEELLAAVNGQSSSTLAQKVVALYRRLAEKRRPKEPVNSAVTRILKTKPDVAAPALQIRFINEKNAQETYPFMVEASVSGNPAKMEVVVTDDVRKEQRFAMQEIAKAQDGFTVHEARFRPFEPAFYRFRIEMTKADGSVEVTKKGFLLAALPGADLNSMSENYVLNPYRDEMNGTARSEVRTLAPDYEISDKDAAVLLKLNGGGFEWNTSAGVKRKSLSGFWGFLRAYESLSAEDLRASVLYHSGRRSAEKPAGDIFYYIQENLLKEAGDSVFSLKARIAEIQQRLIHESDTDDEKATAIEAALTLLSKFGESLAWKVAKDYGVGKTEALEALQDKEKGDFIRKKLIQFLQLHAIPAETTDGDLVPAFEVSLSDFMPQAVAGEKALIIINAGKRRVGSEKAATTVRAAAIREILGSESMDSPKTHVQVTSIASRTRSGNVSGGLRLIQAQDIAQKGLPVEIPGPHDIDIVSLGTAEPEMFAAYLEAAVKSRDPWGQTPAQLMQQEIQKKLAPGGEVNGEAKAFLGQAVALDADRAKSMFGTEGIPVVMAFIAALAPDLLESMKGWDVRVYKMLSAQFSGPNADIYQKGVVQFYETRPTTALLFSKTYNGRRIFIPVYFGVIPADQLDADGKISISVPHADSLGLDLKDGKKLQVRNLLTNRIYSTVHTAESLGVQQGRDDTGRQMGGWHVRVPGNLGFQFLEWVEAEIKAEGARNKFDELMLSVPIQDLGTEIQDGRLVTSDSVGKFREILPFIASKGIGEIYFYGGVFRMSETSTEIHSVQNEHTKTIPVGGGRVTVRVGNYVTKKQIITVNDKQVLMEDNGGNPFSFVLTEDMLPEISPEIFGNPNFSPSERVAELKKLIQEIQALGIKVILDFIPWLAPEAVNEKNYKWFFYKELDAHDAAEYAKYVELGDEHKKQAKIGDLFSRPENGEFFAVRIKESGTERVILVRHVTGAPNVDQAMLNPFSPGARQYYRNYLKFLIDDLGVDGVRSDLAGKLISDQIGGIFLTPKLALDDDSKYRENDEIWPGLIKYAKELKAKQVETAGPEKEKPKTFEFIMESYHGDRGRLKELGGDTFYYKELFENHLAVERRKGISPSAVTGTLAEAFYQAQNDMRLLLFGSNFDQMSMKQIGGARLAMLAKLFAMANAGVPVMVDLIDMIRVERLRTLPGGDINREDQPEKGKRKGHPDHDGESAHTWETDPEKIAARALWAGLKNEILKGDGFQLLDIFNRAVVQEGQEIVDMDIDNSYKEDVTVLGVREPETGSWTLIASDHRLNDGETRERWLGLPGRIAETGNLRDLAAYDVATGAELPIENGHINGVKFGPGPQNSAKIIRIERRSELRAVAAVAKDVLNILAARGTFSAALAGETAELEGLRWQEFQAAARSEARKPEYLKTFTAGAVQDEDPIAAFYASHPDHEAVLEKFLADQINEIRVKARASLKADESRNLTFAFAIRMPRSPKVRAWLLDYVKMVSELARDKEYPGRVFGRIRVLAPVEDLTGDKALKDFRSRIESTGAAKVIELNTARSAFQLSEYFSGHANALGYGLEDLTISGFEDRKVQSSVNVDNESVFTVAALLTYELAEVKDKAGVKRTLRQVSRSMHGLRYSAEGILQITSDALELSYRGYQLTGSSA